MDKARFVVTSSHMPSVTYHYNKDHQLIKKEGPAGVLLEISYDEKGKVKKLKEPSGTIYEFLYKKGATHVYDALGAHTLYRYGEDDRLESIDHFGRRASLRC